MTKFEKIKLVEINSHLTCHLCKGYYIDATTIVECLHSFCRSCIIKFLDKNSYCPICEVIINKAKPNIKPDKTLQDVVYKLVPELFLNEMHRRQEFYSRHPEEAAKVTPEARGEDTERTIFHPRDVISLSIEYTSDESPNCLLPLPLSAQNGSTKTTTSSITRSSSCTLGDLPGATTPSDASTMKRFLQCPAMLRVDVLKKFVSNKYNVDMAKFHIDILYKRVPLPDQYTLIDIAYIYSWKRNEPMRFFFRIMDAKFLQEDEQLQEYVCESPTKVPVVQSTRPVQTKPDLVDENVPPMGVAKDTSQNNGLNAHNVKPIINTVDKDNKVPVPVLNEDNKNNLHSSKTKAKTIAVAPPAPVDVAKDKEKGSKISGVEKLKNCIVMQYVGRHVNSSSVKVAKQSAPVKVKNTAPSPPKIEKASPSPKKLQKSTTPKPPPPKIILKTHPKYVTAQTIVVPSVPITPPPTTKIEFPSSPEVDMEKSQFLKSIQLTAKSNISPEKAETPPSTVKVVPKSPPKISVPKSPLHSVPGLKFSGHSSKRPASSPAKSPKKPKVPKKESPAKKASTTGAKQALAKNGVHNSVVRQMLTNVSQQVTNLRQDVSKIVGQNSPETNSELKSLFDSCKINIPSSLSITLKETDGVNTSKTPTSIKPVQNYIEILKLPDQPLPSPAKAPSEAKPAPKLVQNVQNLQNGVQGKDKPKTPPLPTSEAKPAPLVKEPAPKVVENKSSPCNKVPPKLAVTSKTVKPSNSLDTTQELNKKASSTPNLAQLLQNTPHALPKTTPQPTASALAQSKIENAAKSFQKMFEEAVKNDLNKVVPSFPLDRNGIKKTSDPQASKAQNGTTNKQSNALDLSTPANVTDTTVPGHNNNNKRNIAEIAQQLYKKTKLEQEKQLNNNQCQTKSPSSVNSNGKVAIPRLPAPRTPIPQPIQTFQSYVSQQRTQTQDIKKSPQKALPSPNNPAQPTLKSPTIAISPKSAQITKAHSPKLSASSPKCNLSTGLGDMSPNQLLEKYNIPNLAQLSANFNLAQAGHLAALQQAFVLKQFEMQNRQNWLNMNPNLAVQYEKFLQNLNPQGHQLLGNKSEH